MQGEWVKVGAISLWACFSPGRSPTAVLIHGGLGNCTEWQAQWEFLQAQGQQVLAYDLAGHGASDRYPDYSIGRHYRDLSRLLRHLEVKQPVLCCHSYGVPIGLEFAYWEGAAALIAIGGGTHDLTPWWEVAGVKFLALGGHRLMLRVKLGLPTEAHPYQGLQAFWGYDGRSHKIRCPVLIITSEKDPFFSPAMGAALHQHFAEIGVECCHLNFAGVGHAIPKDAADRVNQAIWQQIQSTRTRFDVVH